MCTFVERDFVRVCTCVRACMRACVHVDGEGEGDVCLCIFAYEQTLQIFTRNLDKFSGPSYSGES